MSDHAIDIDKVVGDPDSLRTAGRTFGRQAAVYNSQVSQLQRAHDSLPSSAFTGAKGELMRFYLRDLTNTASSLRSAYDRIANAAPMVADAIEDAKDAERDLRAARKRTEAAKQDVTRAQQDVAQARAAVGTAQKLQGLGIVHGAAERAAAELRAAEGRLDRATTHLDECTRAEKRARTEYEDAQSARERRTAAFEKLVDDQTAVIARSVPVAPTPPSVSPLADQLTTLGRGGSALNTLIKIQGKLVVAHYEKLGASSQEAKAFAERLTKLGSTASRVYKTSSYGLTVAINTLKTLNDPNLDTREKVKKIGTDSAVQIAGGYAGGAAGGGACAAFGVTAPAAPLCAAGGAAAGSFLAGTIAKLPGVRTVVDYGISKPIGVAYDGAKVAVDAAADASPVGIDGKGFPLHLKKPSFIP